MNKEYRLLLEQLYAKHGHRCHYCGIEEKDIQVLWGEFYGSYNRSRRLEIEHKNGNHKDWSFDNLGLACAVCNCAKTDRFTEAEFLEIGKAIRKVWQARAKKQIVKVKGAGEIVLHRDSAEG